MCNPDQESQPASVSSMLGSAPAASGRGSVERLVAQPQVDRLARRDREVCPHHPVGAGELYRARAVEPNRAALGLYAAVQRTQVWLGAAVLHSRCEFAAHRHSAGEPLNPAQEHVRTVEPDVMAAGPDSKRERVCQSHCPT